MTAGNNIPLALRRPPNDLNADWQALARESARHRDRRSTHNRNVITGLHPIDISRKSGTFYLRRPMLGHVEGQHLTYRKHKELKSLQKPTHPAAKLCMFHLSFRDIARAQAAALFNFPKQRVFN